MGEGVSPEPLWLAPSAVVPPPALSDTEIAAPAGLIVAAEAGGLGRYLAGSEAAERGGLSARA